MTLSKTQFKLCKYRQTPVGYEIPVISGTGLAYAYCCTEEEANIVRDALNLWSYNEGLTDELPDHLAIRRSTEFSAAELNRLKELTSDEGLGKRITQLIADRKINF